MSPTRAQPDRNPLPIQRGDLRTIMSYPGGMPDNLCIETLLQRQFYRPICSEPEIDRILTVQTATDHLLKLRADTIVDNMRLFRVMRNKALAGKDGWSLESAFDPAPFRCVLEQVSPDDVAACRLLTCGSTFSTDPNGTMFKSDFGPIATVDDSLRFFLKFSHLALLSFKTEVPPHVRVNAMRIAIRVMLKTEALDFLMDPRGMVPEDVATAIHAPIHLQLQFVSGHEIMHHGLNHLDNTSVIEKPVFFAVSPRDKDYSPMPVYNKSQSQEFDADAQSLWRPHYPHALRRGLIEAACLWFASLCMFEAVFDAMHPSSPWGYKSHPSAMDRLTHLLESCQRGSRPPKRRVRALMEAARRLSDCLCADVTSNPDLFEFYGSVYLDKPNSEWRGPELVDRRDYY